MKPRSHKSMLLGLLPSQLVTTRVAPGGKRLFLTFDDGPDPVFTPVVLDLLKTHDATASFFLVGESVQRHADIVRRIASEGHQLGNHSWSHPLMTTLSLTEQLDQIDRTDRALAACDGLDRHPFRPPCGALPFDLLMHFARKRRAIAYWSYDSHDYQRLPAATLLPMIRANPPRDGDVILMHDDNAETVELLSRLLPEWLEQGFTIEAMPVQGASA